MVDSCYCLDWVDLDVMNQVSRRQRSRTIKGALLTPGNLLARSGKQKKPDPGRMAETSRAGTGDSMCRSWRYLCSIVLNPVISWNGHNSFQQIFPSNSPNFTTREPWGLFLLCFFFEKSCSKICEKYCLTKVCSRGFMNPLHSPRKEHSKTEFEKKNSEEKFGPENRRLFPGTNLVLWSAPICTMQPSFQFVYFFQ